MNVRIDTIFFSLFLFSFPYLTDAATIVKSNLQVFKEIKHDIETPFLNSQNLFNINQEIKAKFLTQSNNLVPIKTFKGLGAGLGDYQVKALHANVSGSVGLKQFVQTTNYDIGVFDKKTGHLFKGFPQPNNTIWKGFGGECENELGHYAVVKYDQLAQRWVITQTTTSTLCVAISTGENATASYYRYAFNFNKRLQRGKLGLWPNAYFMSFDVVDNNQKDREVLICALDRKKMIAGLNATVQCKTIPEHFSQLIHVAPADLEGTILPQEMYTPGYIFGLIPLDSTVMTVFFKFYVNFNNPNATKLVYINEPSFAGEFPVGSVLQPTGYPLIVDNENVSLNHRVVYRQFSDYGSLLLSYPSGFLSIVTQKWHEYRFYKQQSFPVKIQEGSTYNGRHSHYTGSITMDKNRNIVLADNTCSTAVYPSIEMHYRFFTDAPSNLTYSQPLITGHGIQNAPANNRWGTYSSLSIDPIDNCTFWYTNQYQPTTGTYNWSTAIIYFKLPNCT